MIRNLYNTTIDVLRVTRTSDGMGGWTETKTVHINDLPCRINWSSGNERIQFNKDTWLRDGKLYCGVVDITTNDRIKHEDKTYEIVNISNPDNMNKFLMVEIKLVQ